jgi:hypothetical protein
MKESMLEHGDVFFLIHAPEQGASACPDKSGPFDRLMVLSKVEGHTSNAELTMIRHVGRCPDLLGPANALLLGHGAKKRHPHALFHMKFFRIR